jgi:acetyl-CoA carboxylase/biotin carboxylase 1
MYRLLPYIVPPCQISCKYEAFSFLLFTSFYSQLEPFTCSLLEIPKLMQYKALQYNSSRNRQWSMYTAVERPDPKSYSLRRLFVRGTVRQLGHPALLAACYSGSMSGVAAAAVNELEEGLVSD